MSVNPTLAQVSEIAQAQRQIIEGIQASQESVAGILAWCASLNTLNTSVVEGVQREATRLAALETRYDHGEAIPGPRIREDFCRATNRRQADRLERMRERVDKLQKRERAAWPRAPFQNQSIRENSDRAHLIRLFCEDSPQAQGIAIQLPEVMQ